MKTSKLTYLLFFFTILSVGFISCSDDDDELLKPTKENGKPSSLTISSTMSGGCNVYFYYRGNQLSQEKSVYNNNDGVNTIIDFDYTDGQLSSIFSYLEDENIADGTSSKRFIYSKEDNSVIVEFTAEPSSDIYRLKIEKDQNNIPFKIVQLGSYKAGPDEIQTRAGNYYALFEYNPTSKSIIKQTVYSIETQQVVAIYQYEYDDNIGILSKVELPLWFYAYQAFESRNDNDLYSKMYLNYTNNITNITTTGEINSVHSYTYSYNKLNTPVSMGTNVLGMPFISITY